MDDKLYREFIEDEVAEMKRYKAEKDAEAGTDLGEAPYFDWIDKHSAEFRQNWESAHS